jgi:hypothetical protein
MRTVVMPDESRRCFGVRGPKCFTSTFVLHGLLITRRSPSRRGSSESHSWRCFAHSC